MIEPSVLNESRSKTVTGKVLRNSKDKTTKIQIDWKELHKTGKYIPRKTVFLIHDENNQCVEGDIVLAEECRPFSKRKHMRLVKILKSSNLGENQ